MTIRDLVSQMEQKITDAYKAEVSIEDAERVAAEFLTAQLYVSKALRDADLDARMKKAGLKAVRAQAYLDIVNNVEKKPTETWIDSQLNTNETVSKEQDRYDVSEADKAELERIYDVFREAHIYFRGVARGRFE